MKKQHWKTTVKAIKNCFDIDDICAIVADFAGVKNVIFDDSRAWCLYTHDKPVNNKIQGYANKYGAYRAYLGGGVRGAMQTNLQGGLSQIFATGLYQIEAIINNDCQGCESWEMNTGVLL